MKTTRKGVLPIYPVLSCKTIECLEPRAPLPARQIHWSEKETSALTVESCGRIGTGESVVMVCSFESERRMLALVRTETSNYSTWQGGGATVTVTVTV